MYCYMHQILVDITNKKLIDSKSTYGGVNFANIFN